MATNKLTPKQARFVVEYLIDLNATQAAIRAGYSPKGAEVTGSQLLRNHKVAESISKGKQKQVDKAEITAERVLNELAKVAFANTLDYIRINDQGDPIIDLSAMTREQAAALSEVNTEVILGKKEDDDPVKKVRIKFYDKLTALNTLAKHLGLLTEKVDITSKGEQFGGFIGQLASLPNDEIERRIAALESRQAAKPVQKES